MVEMSIKNRHGVFELAEMPSSMVRVWRPAVFVVSLFLVGTGGLVGMGSAGGAVGKARCDLMSSERIGGILGLRHLKGPTYVGTATCAYENGETAVSVSLGP